MKNLKLIALMSLLLPITSALAGEKTNAQASSAHIAKLPIDDSINLRPEPAEEIDPCRPQLNDLFGLNNGIVLGAFFRCMNKHFPSLNSHKYRVTKN